jgi:hypothetical protein
VGRLIMTTGNALDGAKFEIKVDGMVRTHRDVRSTAIEAARFLQSKGAKIVVTDLRDGSDVLFNEPMK